VTGKSYAENSINPITVHDCDSFFTGLASHDKQAGRYLFHEKGVG
jgi:hypothetical protein